VSGGRSFELRRELGSGAFGSVYLAEMISLGGFRKEVALKVLKPDVEASSDEAVIRLRDEARLLGRVRHRNIVQVDDLVRVDGRWAVVMEYIPGHDLKVVTDALHSWDEHMPWGVALEVIGAVSDALDVAYNTVSDGQKLQVIHRDIKPANIRLTEGGDLKVLDFGIARGEFVEREAETKDVRFGTLQYMAPERVLGDPEAPAGDVYSLAITLYQLLTGELLGRAKLRKSNQQLQVQEALQTLETMTGRLDDEASQLFTDMLTWEPEERPSSREVSDRARALSRRIGDLSLAEFASRVIPRISDESSEAGPPIKGTLSEELSEAVRSEDDTPTLGTTSTVHIAGSRLIWGAVVALFLALLGGGYVLAQVLEQSRQGAESLAAEIRRTASGEEETQRELAELKAVASVAKVEAAKAEAAKAEAAAKAQAARAEAARRSASSSPAAGTAPTAAAAEVVGTTMAASAGEDGRLRSVKFKVDGATALKVVCGDTKATGTSSVLLRNPPATSCRVRATIAGTTYKSRTSVNESRGYVCVVQGTALTCS